MKKKVLSVLLSTAMIASVLVGCGGDSAAPATPAADGGTTAADSGADTGSDAAASGGVQEIT